MKRTKRTSQVATTRVICNHLPISQKAYDGFRERIRKVHEYLGYDAGDMLTMLDEYLAGDKDAGGGCCLADKMAFMLMRDEIDRAMARSARARENARLRRARKEQERQERERQEAFANQETEIESVAVCRQDVLYDNAESKSLTVSLHNDVDAGYSGPVRPINLKLSSAP